MKKLALALTALAALSGQALAADMPMKSVRPAPAPVAVANWTGCYISGGIGYGLFDQENTLYDYTGSSRVRITDGWDTGGRGWTGRAQTGCDYQFGGIGSWNMVIGLFGDYDWTDIHGRVNDPFFGSVSSEKMSGPLRLFAAEDLLVDRTETRGRWRCQCPTPGSVIFAR